MNSKFSFFTKVASFFSLFYLVPNCKMYSQIIYTDIVDATPNVSYSLDVNNDTIVDFYIVHASLNKILCVPQNSNAYAGNILAGVYSPWALPAGSFICDTMAAWFDSSKVGTMAFGSNIGNWAGAVDKYLPLKLAIGANTYYGWARLDFFVGSTSFTIKDYAYNSTPNACIQAGQTVLSVLINTNKSIFSIVPNPFVSTTTILTNNYLNNASIIIFNAFGQIVKEIKSITGNSFNLNRENLPSGLYFLQLKEENNVIAIEKLIIAN